MFIVKFAEKMIAYFSEIAILLLGIAAMSLLVVIFREEGLLGVWKTIRVDVIGVTVKFIPIIIVFFTITGAIDHLQHRHPQKFKDIIAGKNGTAMMIGLAAAMPGPAGGQQLQDAWNGQDVNRTKILLCLVGMMALSINTILFRSKVLGGPLTLIWLSIALALLGQVWVVGRLKPWTWFG